MAAFMAIVFASLLRVPSVGFVTPSTATLPFLLVGYHCVWCGFTHCGRGTGMERLDWTLLCAAARHRSGWKLWQQSSIRIGAVQFTAYESSPSTATLPFLLVGHHCVWFGSLTVAAELGWKDLIGHCFAQLHDMHLGGNFGNNPPSGLALSSSLLMSLHLWPPPCHFFWWGTIVFDLASLTVAAELGWKDLIGHCFAQLHDMHLGGNFGNNPPSGLALSSSLLMSLRQLVASEDGVGGTRGLTAAYGTLSLHPICSCSSWDLSLRAALLSRFSRFSLKFGYFCQHPFDIYTLDPPGGFYGIYFCQQGAPW